MRIEAWGFSLLEVSFSLFLTTIIITIALRVLISCQFAQHRDLQTAETAEMWRNVCRVLSQDIHSTTRISMVSNNLNAVSSSGVSYRYIVNGNHQFVRIQLGGGTSVIAVGVASIDAVLITPSACELTVEFVDGTERSMCFASLDSIM